MALAPLRGKFTAYVSTAKSVIFVVLARPLFHIGSGHGHFAGALHLFRRIAGEILASNHCFRLASALSPATVTFAGALHLFRRIADGRIDGEI